MARTSYSKATHALVGIGPDGGAGVVHWHDNELDAARDAREINAAGGNVQVVTAPGGELSEQDRGAVENLVWSAVGTAAPEDAAPNLVLLPEAKRSKPMHEFRFTPGIRGVYGCRFMLPKIAVFGTDFQKELDKYSVWNGADKEMEIDGETWISWEVRAEDVGALAKFLSQRGYVLANWCEVVEIAVRTIHGDD
jgi:hypothetical protein